ncbi:MAG: molecular chaperone DnaK [Candidatus Bipolaricaulota bacterium]|nr:molecular chaperone DnaK [Candidatus Bipolaricaulota bacterium]MCS7273855.1 molecular chaperone DnaK [Candidatus Bipolaricaulota bacterium]MDW8110727.1 molecular chaperone DnaK [Candidatus Bipolaricaulota bacterium]
MPKERIVGIDLGTTKSVIALMEGGKPEVITNAEGERITPSVVAFTEQGERLVGTLAKRQAIVNPERTILEIKRKMGTDERVRIPLASGVKEYTPEEISAMILQKLKRDAEEKLGFKLNKAVITVPAYFNQQQRQATKDAGKIAGFDVERIINEPTAASLAYGLDKDKNETILVYDLGGGTFDVTILEIGDGVFEVKATSGDTYLGGKDFDQRIIDWLIQEFKDETGIDVRKDLAALQRLKEAAENAKKELSFKTETLISLPYLAADARGPKHLERRLTRAKFQALTDDLVDRSMRIVEQALRDAKLSPKDIQQVVMVGGSTRMPRVQERVAELFGSAKINKEINPDEVVAMGAAIQAGVLAGEVDEIVLLDVTPLTLSIETLGGIATPIIERNTTIPVERTKTFTTAEDGQTQVEIHIVQGERKLAQDNKSLGRFQLTGIPPAPRGVPQIDVTFSIDVNGILHVTAKDKATNKSASIVIKEPSRLSEEELKRMREEAERYAEEDRRRVEEIETRNRADHLVYSMEKALREHGERVSATTRERLQSKANALKEKLKTNAPIAEIRQLMKELEEASLELGREIYQATGPQAPGGRSEQSSQGTKGDYIDAEYEKRDDDR